jgi:hypothetical protein
MAFNLEGHEPGPQGCDRQGHERDALAARRVRRMRQRLEKKHL